MLYRDLLSKLKRDIAAAMDGLVQKGGGCALVDFPNYANVGDSAIWLGEIAYLREMGMRVAYTCDHDNFNLGQMRARLSPGDTILLSGGGNFGDVWPKYQRFREMIVEEFHDHRIVQLAQTVKFNDADGVGRARAVFGGHPNFTLLVRDHESLDFCGKHLAVPCRLCPDFALWMGPRQRPSRPDCNVLWMSRTDHESGGEAVPPLGNGEAGPVDWLEDGLSLSRITHILLSRAKKCVGTGFPGLVTAQRGLFTPMASERLRRGERLLSRGKTVVTNRLHGHIMCLLLGIPHVLLDNNYGKVANFYRAWTQECDIVELAGEPREALAKAREMGSTVV